MTPPSTHRATGPSEALVLAALRKVPAGSVTVRWPDGSERRHVGTEPGPDAIIEIKRPSAIRRAAFGGPMGFAEGYLDGEWDTPDLDAVLDLGAANIAAGHAVRMPEVFKPLLRAWQRMRDNSSGGSKRNIEYHYDLGNEFYRLWLDETMSYSAACFDGECALEDAQRRKWDRMLEMVQPDSSTNLLEIGCGWGGFAIHAAKESGCKVTGVTLSDEQYAFARQRVAEEGLEGRVDIRLQDYRDVPGQYSAIASIEMFEAVGERWWPVFFRRLNELTGPRGVVALQTITISDDRFESYRSGPDFTQRYIFPGGMLPSPSRFAEVASESGLTVGEPHFFGHDYAQTLSAWRERFEAALPEVRALGFDERFIRMWRYYLSYCRAGFAFNTIDVMQVRLSP